MKKTLLILTIVTLFFAGCRKIDVFESGTEAFVRDGKILCCAVDLGLPSGVKWADRNIGAESEDASGGYYDYSYDYDVATNELGDCWRLPTDSELEELMDECIWTWTESGYEVTGPNGNSIFLPAAGYGYESISGTTEYYDDGDGYYMSSTLKYDDYVKVLNITSASCFIEMSHVGEYLRSVRPVSD